MRSSPSTHATVPPLSATHSCTTRRRRYRCCAWMSRNRFCRDNFELTVRSGAWMPGTAGAASGLRDPLLRPDAQALEELTVLFHVRVAGGQQLFAIEDGIGARQEAQGLHLIGHALASS